MDLVSSFAFSFMIFSFYSLKNLRSVGKRPTRLISSWKSSKALMAVILPKLFIWSWWIFQQMSDETNKIILSNLRSFIFIINELFATRFKYKKDFPKVCLLQDLKVSWVFIYTWVKKSRACKLKRKQSTNLKGFFALKRRMANKNLELFCFLLFRN